LGTIDCVTFRQKNGSMPDPLQRISVSKVTLDFPARKEFFWVSGIARYPESRATRAGKILITASDCG
jgi:hypothetical protein